MEREQGLIASYPRFKNQRGEQEEKEGVAHSKKRRLERGLLSDKEHNTT